MKRIFHVANIDLTNESGMGRIALKWKNIMEKNAIQFIHIGKEEINPLHNLLFGYQASYFIKINYTLNVDDLILIHEPAAIGFNEYNNKIIFSHGMEENYFIKSQKNREKLFSSKSRVYLPLLFYLIRKSYKNILLSLVCNTEDEKFIKEYYNVPFKKIIRYNNGYNYLIHNSKSFTDQDTITILFNSSWIPRKGIDVVVKVFNIILTKYNTKLLITGAGFDSDSIKKQFQNNVRDRIEIIEKFSADSEVKYYKRSHFYLLPSYGEGQSLSLLQAMAAGLCCIVTNNSGQKDLINDGYNGYLFETGDWNGCLTKFEYCLENMERMQYISNNAIQSIKALSWEAATNDLFKNIKCHVNIN